MTSEDHPVEVQEYQVRGPSLKYKCPQCKAALMNPIWEGGIEDSCPNCKCFLIVPGKDRRDELENKHLVSKVYLTLFHAEMRIKYPCRYCGAKLNSTINGVGCLGKCAKCRGRFRIPLLPEEERQTVELIEQEAREKRERRALAVAALQQARELRKQETNKEKVQQAAFNTKSLNCCTSCSEPIQSNWKVCPHCGEPSATVKHCHSCREPVEPDWKACPHCGQPRKSTNTRHSKSEKRILLQWTFKSPYFYGVVLVGAGIGLGAFAILGGIALLVITLIFADEPCKKKKIQSTLFAIVLGIVFLVAQTLVGLSIQS